MIQWSAGNSVNLNHLPIVVNVQTHARLGERGKQARHRPPLGRELQRLASRLGGDAPELQGVDAVFALAVLAVADLGHRVAHANNLGNGNRRGGRRAEPRDEAGQDTSSTDLGGRVGEHERTIKGKSDKKD